MGKPATNYDEIFALIDEANKGYIKAEKKLITLGIFNEGGDVITEDPNILQYFEDKWSEE